MNLRSFLRRLLCGYEDAVETVHGTAERPPIPQPKIYAPPKVTPLGKSIVLKNEPSGIKEIATTLHPPERRIGDDGEVIYRPAMPPKVVPLSKSITRQEDGWLIRTSWQVSTEEEARVYGYAYLGSRMETPFPVPGEFAAMVKRQLVVVDVVDTMGITRLYNDLQQYFKVQARTWHQVWTLLEVDPYKPTEDDKLVAGSQIVHARVLIPAWAIFNPIYQDQPDSRLKDDDYFVLSCAVSVKGTRDTQDVRAEAVQTVTVKELKEA